MSNERLSRVFDLAYECLRRKINGKRISVDNEASLQLQFAAILKDVGELLTVERDEYFTIELEKAVSRPSGLFLKSSSEKAKIDIFFSYNNRSTGEVKSCAIEMKFFKQKNMREPNNRYDTYVDLHNLENYGSYADLCYLVVATDHGHYVDKISYSPDTCDFDLRHGKSYVAGTTATYRTKNPYGAPITLARSYNFSWDTTEGGLHFLQLAVEPLQVGPVIR
jgi:hypothetical protein